MRFLRSCSVACAFALGLSALSPALAVKASAADTAFLTKAEVRALYGDSIPFTYLSSETGNFEQSTFTIQNVNSDFRTVGGWNVQGQPNFSNWEFIYYSSPWGLQVSSDNSEITVELNPQYSIIDTENFTAFVGLSSDTAVSSAAYSASVWNCRSSISGDIYGYSPEIDSQYSVTGFTGSTRFAVDRFVICPINYSSQSSGAFSSLSCKFRGCTVSRSSGMNQRLYFVVGFPRVTVGASSSSGTVSATTLTETSASGSGSGSGGDDLTETNSLLSRIIAALSSLGSFIVDGIAGLFLPDSEYLSDWLEDMQDLLENSLGGIYDCIQIISDFFTGLVSITPSDTLDIPTVTIPLLKDQSFTTGNWHIKLGDTQEGNAGYTLLYNSIKILFDFLATAAFLNMCKKKLYGILSPSGEVVIDGD